MIGGKDLFFVLSPKYAYDNPEELIIWSPHPAEVPNSPLIKNYIENLLPPNLFAYGKQYQLNFMVLNALKILLPTVRKVLQLLALV